MTPSQSYIANNPWAGIALITIVVVSLFASLLYSVRVVRNRTDPLRWALLGVLLSLALTNIPALAVYFGNPLLPVWGIIFRFAAAFFLLWAVWPLLHDSVSEFKACLGYIKHRGK